MEGNGERGIPADERFFVCLIPLVVTTQGTFEEPDEPDEIPFDPADFEPRKTRTMWD